MRLVPNCPRRLRILDSSAAMTSPSTIPQFSNCVTSCAKCDEFEPFVEWHLDSFVWCSVSACDARRGLQDHDSQHGDSLGGARIVTAPAVEHSAIQPIADG